MTEVFLQASKLPVFFFSASAKMKSRFTGLMEKPSVKEKLDRYKAQAKQQKEAERKEPEVKNCLLYTSTWSSVPAELSVRAMKIRR